MQKQYEHPQHVTPLLFWRAKFGDEKLSAEQKELLEQFEKTAHVGCEQKRTN